MPGERRYAIAWPRLGNGINFRRVSMKLRMLIPICQNPVPPQGPFYSMASGGRAGGRSRGVPSFSLAPHIICDTVLVSRMSKPRKWTKVQAFPHRLGLTIDDELLDHLDTTAGNLGISRAEVIRRAIRAGVDDLEKEKETNLLFTLDRK